MKRLVQSEKNDYYCDTCGKELLVEFLGVPISVDFGYGHELDGEEYHFCTYTCLLQFITAELKKTQSKDERFIYGGGD